MHLVKRVLKAAITTDWPAVRWIGPLRITIVATTAVAIGIAMDGPSGALPLAIGTLFVGFADQRGEFDERARGVLIAVLLVTSATLIGVVVSSNTLAHIVMAGIFAAFCGYIGLAGPRAALAGVVALVTFAVFSGTPTAISDGGPLVLKVFIGAIAMASAVIIPMLTGRIGGLRTDVVVALRAQSFALRGKVGGIDGTNVAAKLGAARGRLQASGCYGETLVWLDGLLSEAHAMRLGFLALNGARDERDPGQQERVGELKCAASDLLLALASALEIPLARRRIEVKREAFDVAARSCRAGLAPRSLKALSRIETAAGKLSDLVQGQWPIGRRCKFSRRLSAPLEPVAALLHRRDPNSLFTRHALRISALMVIATTISEFDGLPHSFWIPLTVAWVARSDFASTTARVTQRVLGTLFGVIIALLVIDLIGASVSLEIVMFATGAMVCCLFLVANYTICTVGVTLWLMAVLDINSAPLETRVFQTLVAGVLVIIASQISPTRTSTYACAGIANLIAALRAYCSSIIGRDRSQLEQSQALLLAASLKATTLVEELGHEPGNHLLHYEHAVQINASLRAAAEIAVSCDEGSEDQAATLPTAHQDLITELSLASLDGLGARLEAAQQSGVIAVGIDRGRPNDKSSFDRLISEAEDHLDELALYRQAATTR